MEAGILEANVRRLGWTAARSNIEGYNRTYELETPDGDIIKLDFNARRQMVRLQLALSREYGRQYVAVIKSGTILQEKDFASRRSLDLSSRFSPFRKYFEFLPDTGALKAIGGSYGYPVSTTGRPKRRLVSSGARFIGRRSQYGFRRFLNVIRGNRSGDWARRLWDRLVSEGVFALPAVGAMAAYQFGALGLAELAALLGFTGIMSGAAEWILGRDPFLPRVILMLLAAAFAVHTEVQSRMFGIFL